MRKIICILAVLTLILSMAACAKEAPAEVTVLPSTVPPETTEETTETTTSYTIMKYEDNSFVEVLKHTIKL